MPDEDTQAVLRWVARRVALTRQLVRAKNEIYAAVMRCLLGPPPVSDLSDAGPRLAGRPAAEAEMVASALGQGDFLYGEIAELDHKIAKTAVADPQFTRLMTILASMPARPPRC